jgi:dihydropteroate synthase
MAELRLGTLSLDCPAVMGILNVTPDSFSDGGKFVDLPAAVRHAEQMAVEGAALIDIGGESTRPGAASVEPAEEIDRVVPVIEAVRAAVDVPVSVDTSKPEVMREAVSAGAAMINDVRALREPGALAAASQLGTPVCLMHMQGQPRTMQDNPHYGDVVAEVTQFLADRAAECVGAGISRDLLIVDPGLGFGKSPGDNVELLANLRQLCHLGFPVLIGISRKSTLGIITGRDVNNRLPASLAAAVIAVERGASIIRAHEVGETVDALKVARTVLNMDDKQ